MSSKSDAVNKVEAFLLIKLMEECAEVIQACSKILEHGFAPVGYDNQNQLAKELGDVLAVMHVLCESVRTQVRNDALNHRNIEHFAADKRAILRELAAKRPSKE